jgi:hypothetical protein
VARLREKSTGATAAQISTTVELRPAAEAEYEADVEAEYPPE